MTVLKIAKPYQLVHHSRNLSIPETPAELKNLANLLNILVLTAKIKKGKMYRT